MKGNFSFFILIVGLIQVAVMIVVAKREKCGNMMAILKGGDDK